MTNHQGLGEGATRAVRGHFGSRQFRAPLAGSPAQNPKPHDVRRVAFPLFALHREDLCPDGRGRCGAAAAADDRALALQSLPAYWGCSEIQRRGITTVEPVLPPPGVGGGRRRAPAGADAGAALATRKDRQEHHPDEENHEGHRCEEGRQEHHPDEEGHGCEKNSAGASPP